MVKEGTVAPKEVMEINSMLAMITKDKYLFHPRVLPRLPLLARYHHSHRFKSASPDISILIYVGTICLLPYWPLTRGVPGLGFAGDSSHASQAMQRVVLGS